MPYEYLPFLDKAAEAWWRNQTTERMAEELARAKESVMFARHEASRLGELVSFLSYEIDERRNRAARIKARHDREAAIRDSIRSAAERKYLSDQYAE